MGVFFYNKSRSVASSISSSSNQTNTQISDNTINIKNFSFNPNTITIKKGTTVTWINQDSTIHTVKSDTFNSPDLNQGDKFQFTFNNAGTFNYSCGIHPSMTGKIVVE